MVKKTKDEIREEIGAVSVDFETGLPLAEQPPNADIVKIDVLEDIRELLIQIEINTRK